MLEAKGQIASHGRRYLIEFVRTLGVPFVVLALIGFLSLLGSLRDPRRALLPVWTAATLVASLAEGAAPAGGVPMPSLL